MSGRFRAALAGVVVGAVIVVVIEIFAVVINGEKFFGTQQSWLLLALGVLVFGWGQLRVYDRRQHDGSNHPGADHERTDEQ